MKKAYYLKVCTKLWKFRSWICIFHLCWKLIDEVISYVLSQVKKNHFSRPDFYKKESGRAVFLLFIISYRMLSLHIITFPQGYVGAVRSKINTTKHQI